MTSTGTSTSLTTFLLDDHFHGDLYSLDHLFFDDDLDWGRRFGAA